MAANAAAALLLGAVVLAYAGLIPIGHWQDEFDAIPFLVERGWAGLWLRVVTWSPRPFSEALLFLYAHLVQNYRSNLIAPVLSALWLMFGASAVLVPVVLRHAFPSRNAMMQGVLLGLGIFCLMLVGHPVAEFFYWPQSAIAYIPATAGIVVAMWLLLAGGATQPGGRSGASVMLALSALSAEVGAIFVLAFCLLAFSFALADHAGKRAAPASDAPVKWLIAPFVAALSVLLLVRQGRFESTSEIFGDAAVAHHLLPSLVAAAGTFVREVVSIDGAGATFTSLFLGLVTKGGFFGASYLISRPLIRSRTGPVSSGRMIALFGVASLATVFLTLAAAYYQFGLVCCQRHGTFRQGLVLVSLVSLAAFAAHRRAGRPMHAGDQAAALPIVLLLASVAVPAMTSVSSVWADYQTLGKRLELTRANWQAGMAAGDRFVYQTMPQGRIVGGLIIGQGTYDSAAAGAVSHLVRYFGKEGVIVRDPESMISMPGAHPSAEAHVIGAASAQCYIDAIDDAPYTGAPVRRRSDGLLSVRGWAAPPEGAGDPSPRTLIVAISASGESRYFDTTAEPRPDVAAALGRPRLGNAGFRANLNLPAEPHEQVLRVRSVAGGAAYECSLSVRVD